MKQKRYITHLGHKKDKTWVLVKLPVDGNNETRAYEFPKDKIEGLVEISDTQSALLLDNDKQILVSLPHDELRRQFHTLFAHARGSWDLTKVTGHTDKIALNDAFKATLPKERPQDATIPEQKDLYITLFGHFRLDKNPTAKYCPITIKWDDIQYVKASQSTPNTTYMTLYEPIIANGIKDERDIWWFDLPANRFQELVNDAQMKGDTHLDIREQTRKKTPRPPHRPRRAFR